MGVAPRLPTETFTVKDMRWARDVATRLDRLERGQGRLRTNVDSLASQHSSTAAATATNAERSGGATVVPGTPHVPSTPTVISRAGLVSLRWDGAVYANLTYTPGPDDDRAPLIHPDAGFSYVTAYRATDPSATWVPVGTRMFDAGSLIDAEVTVGVNYWYRFTATNIRGVQSDPSTAVAITVSGDI